VTLFVCHGVVPDSPGYDEHFAFLQIDRLTLQVNAQASSQHEEQFVLAIVVMPGQDTFDLRTFT
jgi:hypothetical protein